MITVVLITDYWMKCEFTTGHSQIQKSKISIGPDRDKKKLHKDDYLQTEVAAAMSQEIYLHVG